MAATGFVVVRYTAHNWEQMKGYSWQMDWVWVPAAVVTMSVFFLGLAIGWRSVVAWHDTALPWNSSLWVWVRSSFTRYLPTPIWAIASRIYLTTQLGVPWRVAAFSLAGELVGSIGGAFAIALLAVSLWFSISTLFLIAGVVGSVVVILPIAYSCSLSLTRRFNVLPSCSLYGLAGWSAQYAITFAVFGVANILVLKSLGFNVPPINLILGVSALAWAIGTLNVFSPSGLGTREIILALGLGSYLPPPELLAFGIGSRLAAVFGELFLFSCIYLVKSINQWKASNVTNGSPSFPENISP